MHLPAHRKRAFLMPTFLRRPDTASPQGSTARSGAALAALVLGALLAACAPKQSEDWSGYAEGEYVYVAPALAGTLARLDAQRGHVVEAGAPLFALEAISEQAARAEAIARVDAARAQAANSAKGRRSDELAVVEAQLAQARTQAQLAANELTRQQGLVAQGFVSPAHLDEARTAAAQAQARVGEISAALRVARLPARADEQAAAVAQVQAAEQALAQSTWREDQKLKRAPLRSRVAETFFREGEWVNAGQPVVALLPEGGVKARFFVPQAEVGALALGQTVTLRCDGCGAALPARISFIATQAEYTPPVIYSNAQRAKLVFMIEARPTPADAARLRPGLPLDVRRPA
jgi:HlyD family secretion protein